MESGDLRNVEQRRIISNGGFIYQSDISGDNNIIMNDNRGDHDDCRDTWGTWEELLLASAVKRHGVGSWEAVAAEVQARTTVLPPSSSTPDACRLKYSDLHLRFTDPGTGTVEQEAAIVPWLEELRKLRVAELKREVQRFDVSILSLQLKVKRLEEEREKSLQSKDDVTEEDEDESKFQRSKKWKSESSDLERSGTGKPVENQAAKSVESDEERSVNESNSTGSGGGKRTDKVAGKTEIDIIQAGSEVPDPDSSGYFTKEDDRVTGDDRKFGGEDSVSQVSGEAESSASLGKGKGRSVRGRWGGNKIETTRPRGDAVGPGIKKSEPLISGLLELIRTHKHGPIFQNLLHIKETEAYTKLVRQHLDMRAIEAKLEQGSYSSHLSFYRDLLLMFNNAIVFFPKSSTEYAAALELCLLVSSEMKNESQKSDSTLVPSVEVKNEIQKPDLFLTRNKTVIACRRRSSMAAKPSSFGPKMEVPVEQLSSSVKSVSEPKPAGVELMLKSEDRPVTGARSTRRTKKTTGRGGNGSLIKKRSPSVSNAGSAEIQKPESWKADASAVDKKRSAADFLKRIKTSSPIDSTKKSQNSKKDSNSGDEIREKEKRARKNSEAKTSKEEHNPKAARPAKKAVETSSSSVSGKRGRSKSSSRKSKKRSRK